MKMYREEPTLAEWEKMLEEHSRKVPKSKEAAIRDLQEAGILDESGNLAEHYRNDVLSVLDEAAQEMCTNLGEQITKAREELKLTQADLAARAELKPHTIAQAEYGDVSIFVLTRIAMALGKELRIRLDESNN